MSVNEITLLIRTSWKHDFFKIEIERWCYNGLPRMGKGRTEESHRISWQVYMNMVCVLYFYVHF